MRNFEEAALLLPESIAHLLLQLPEQNQNRVTELRVRRSKPLVVMLGDMACFLTDGGKLINHYSAHCVSVSDSDFDGVVIFNLLVASITYQTEDHPMFHNKSSP